MVDLIKNGDAFRHPGIYKIINTKTGKVYVGSSVDMNRRLRTHFNALKHNSHKNEHLQSSFNKHGKDCFNAEIIEIVDISGLDRPAQDKMLWSREQFWMDKTKCYVREFGYNNSLEAGRVTPTPEFRAKLSKALRGRKYSEETLARMSKSSKGRRHSEETRRKMSIDRKGRIVSEETKRKISEGNKGKNRQGTPHTEESKRKISMANKGKTRRGTPHTEESRRKISEANTGKVRTEEARRNMSEGRRREFLKRQKLKEEQAKSNS